VKAFVTGATGFIGGNLAKRLRARGDSVAALVRSPEKAGDLRDAGCELVEGDLADEGAIRAGLDGCDAVFHVGAVYKVGIRTAEQPAMYDANVEGTKRVLDAAIDAGIARIVYVSTNGVFGNTRGKVVDESYERQPLDFLSYYEETKVLAHREANSRIEAGAPILIAQPGGVYGPGDTSQLGNFIDQVRKGRMPLKVFPESGFNFVHVDDVIEGILLVHDQGRLGETYILGGEIATVDRLIELVARLSGRRPPRFTLPPMMAKLAIPFGPVLGPLFKLPPNLREGIRSAQGVTYWGTHEKAKRELGYSPRALETGLRQTLEALKAA
jgi:nucleoside-diphosphate-sugar epimerase